MVAGDFCFYARTRVGAMQLCKAGDRALRVRRVRCVVGVCDEYFIDGVIETPSNGWWWGVSFGPGLSESEIRLGGFR